MRQARERQEALGQCWVQQKLAAAERSKGCLWLSWRSSGSSTSSPTSKIAQPPVAAQSR